MFFLLGSFGSSFSVQVRFLRFSVQDEHDTLGSLQVLLMFSLTLSWDKLSFSFGILTRLKLLVPQLSLHRCIRSLGSAAGVISCPSLVLLVLRCPGFLQVCVWLSLWRFCVVSVPLVLCVVQLEVLKLYADLVLWALLVLILLLKRKDSH